ncbi:MAG: DsbC family protein [Gammaproteobacteria bacterium]
MFKRLSISAALAGAVLLSACDAASDTPKVMAAADSSGPATISSTLDLDAVRKKFPALSPDDIAEAPVPGWFEIDSGGQVLYISGDGKYALRGDLIDLETRVNLTDLRRNTARQNLMASIGQEDMIVYSPEGETKHQITVFTDVDCGYCRKLHQEMDAYHQEGIEIRYLFYPRSGPNTASWEKAASVWCSDDRNEALTKAKAGERLSPQQCDASSINDQFEAGRKVGLRGTPAIVTESGELISGYMPAKALVTRIETGGLAR